MRDQSFDSQSFVCSLETFADCDTVRVQSSELLSRITPNDEGLYEEEIKRRKKSNFRAWPEKKTNLLKFENSFVLKDKSLSNLVCLAIVSWYIPEELGILLRMELSKLSGNEDLFILRFLVENKGIMLCFLEETSLWHTRDFFGNIATQLPKCLNTVRPRFSSTRKPTRVQRHRGYRDKGSLRLKHEYHSFAEGTLEQQKIEEAREISNFTADYIFGFLS